MINRTWAAAALPSDIGGPCRIVRNGEEIHERSTYIPKVKKRTLRGNWRGEVLF